MRILYLDCFSGISGDMTVAALADAGADRNYIERELKRIQLEPYELKWSTVIKCGVSALKFDVVLDPDNPPVHHRHYADIAETFKTAGFNDRVTRSAMAVLEMIGKAEGKIHGIPLEQVHFHEVGAIDSIVDIAAVALALDSLRIDRIVASPVPLGSGIVKCSHGIYPVPAPATLEMMKGIPVADTDFRMEMTTPTGAGIVSALADDFRSSMPPMTVESIGYGAGTRDLPNQPNVLRAIVGEATQTSKTPGHLIVGHVHDHHHDHLHNHHHDHDHQHKHD